MQFIGVHEIDKPSGLAATMADNETLNLAIPR